MFFILSLHNLFFSIFHIEIVDSFLTKQAEHLYFGGIVGVSKYYSEQYCAENSRIDKDVVLIITSQWVFNFSY